MENPKTSTDPQENEIDSNMLGDAFETVFGRNDREAGKPEAEKEGESKTLDEHQDPAND